MSRITLIRNLSEIRLSKYPTQLQMSIAAESNFASHDDLNKFVTAIIWLMCSSITEEIVWDRWSGGGSKESSVHQLPAAVTTAEKSGHMNKGVNVLTRQLVTSATCNGWSMQTWGGTFGMEMLIDIDLDVILLLLVDRWNCEVQVHGEETSLWQQVSL